MKKTLRRIFAVLGGTILLILLALILIPVFFGDQIKEEAKKLVNNQLNATVYWADMDISIFRDFPNLTVSMDKFGVINKEPFEGDTLTNVEHLRVVVDVMSLFGEKYEVVEVRLEEPMVNVQVNKAGIASWDVMKPSTDTSTAPTDTSAAAMVLDLSSYAIVDGNVIYDDQASDLYAKVLGLNHSGSGNFNGDQYDFDTKTTAEAVTVRAAGIEYLTEDQLDADLTLGIDNAQAVYTLKENRIGLNALNLHFDGLVRMPGDDIGVDITFETDNNKFSEILSMVPGIYTKDFKDIETDGTFNLSGYAKGTYNESSLPGFSVNLDVQNAYFHYPDLPEQVSDINIEAKADCPSGDLNKLAIMVPKFHAKLGQNPIDARLNMTGVMSESYNIDAMAKAKLNLESLLAMFPMEGYEIKGDFELDGTAKGTYNAAANQMPAVNAKMTLSDGHFKVPDFPSTIDNARMNATMMAPSQNLTEASLNVSEFHAEVDGSPIDAQLKVDDFEAINYDLMAKGKLDLEKLAALAELEETVLKGMADLDIQTKGNLAAIEAERYTELPTQGNLVITDFYYQDPLVPQGVGISRGEIDFTPQKMDIKQMNGTAGSSKFQATGALTNYLAWALGQDAEMKGTMNAYSPLFNINEWVVMETPPAGGSGAEAPAEEIPMVVFEVPAGVDMIIDCKVDRAIYDNLNMDDVRGQLFVKNQAIDFKQIRFNTLGGSMLINGRYATPDPSAPDLSLDYVLTGVDIGGLWGAFEMVKQFAPVGKYVTGRLNSSLHLEGKLDEYMMPDFSTITSVGDLNILNGVVKGFPVLEKVASRLKLDRLSDLSLEKLKVLFEVYDGRVWVDEKNPLSLPISNGKMTATGSHGLNNTLDYNMNFDIPAGNVGTKALDAVGGLIRSDLGDRFKVNLGLGGTTLDPKITYVKTDGGAAIKDKIEEKKEELKATVEEKKEEVKEKVEEKVDEAKEKARAEADKILADARKQADKIRAEAKEAAARARTEANQRANDVEASAGNPLEKVAKKKAADKIREAGDAAAGKIEREADEKANKLMQEAQQRADALLK